MALEKPHRRLRVVYVYNLVAVHMAGVCKSRVVNRSYDTSKDDPRR